MEDILEAQRKLFSLVPDKLEPEDVPDGVETELTGEEIRKFIEQQRKLVNLVRNPFAGAIPLPLWSKFLSSSTANELFFIGLENQEKYMRVSVHGNRDVFVTVGGNTPKHDSGAVGVAVAVASGTDIVLNVEPIQQVYVRIGDTVSATNQARVFISAWI